MTHGRNSQEVGGEQNGHSANSVVGKSHPQPTRSRPSMPTFPPQMEAHHGERQPTFEKMREDWKNANLEEDISYKDYADLRMRYSRGGNKGGYFNDDLRRKLSKVNLSPFDGSGSISTEVWVMKADTYFQLNPMPEEEAIKFVTLHLEGVAHEWWHHRTITLGHDQIKTYAKFTERLIERFDGKDPELNFKDLAQLRQTGSVDQFIVEFQKLSVLVMDISERRRVVLFMNGLTERLKGWVKGFNPSTLSEAIYKARSMASLSTSSSSSRSHSHPKPLTFPMDKPPPKKPSLDEASRQELRRKKLCFNCKGPWQPGHRCLGKGKIHYIEVVSDEDEHGQEELPIEDNQPNNDTNIASLNRMERIAALVQRGGSIALAGSPRCTVFRVRGTLQGERVTVMLDSRATLNFIN